MDRVGGLDHRFPQATWKRPQALRLEEDGGELLIAWDAVPHRLGDAWDAAGSGKDREGRVECSDDGQLFLRFLRLADAPPKRVLAFAQRYGPLYLCQHGQPQGHEMVVRRPEDAFCFVSTREPVWVWKCYAQWARSLILVAAAVYRGKSGEEAAAFASAVECRYRIVGVRIDAARLERDWRSMAPEARKRILETNIRDWLRDANLRPRFSWIRESPELDLTGKGMFGAITRHLLFALNRAAGFAICDECGTPFAPTRRPRADQRSFCPECGKTAADKHAQRERRARQRAHHGGA